MHLIKELDRKKIDADIYNGYKVMRVRSLTFITAENHEISIH